MKTSPAVSVVIPTYRHENFVEATLESVFAQTFTDYEVIVVNDGSPDRTADRLRPLAEAGRIRFYEQANAGQAAARNRGLAEARGEFVAFLDDDDLWPPDKLAWQVETMREHPDWVMLSGLAGSLGADGVMRESSLVDNVITFLSAEAMFDSGCINSPGLVLIRRAALAVVGGFDPDLWGTDDADLWIRLAAYGTAVRIGRNALYYRIHAGNASNDVARMFWNSVRMARKNLLLLPRERRRHVWRSVLACIYVYAGTHVIKQARRGGLRARWAALRVLAYVLPTGLCDLTLARLISTDVLPQWIQNVRERMRPARMQ